ncbi:2-isopropylmalate synthase [Paramagnetospirillum magneticum]|uniref:2-isopropylmalate synthase n=1 Tax=Paramagnetospirillum magneticum (strain ATCC 700264 / AMB-1) TaxID=342108 RepID=Q2W1K3_PARM1|nr:2-isopropylmalate synthase [Paramagnetospirillum magneticum]BAE52272.1 Isopropylmalate/homocitrate/citramalate synthase [Paramagnetospirillum magneticum AMB-1]
MMPAASTKYRAYPAIRLAQRRWPDATITRPPVWCSVDLRDGNQALIDPMGSERKMALWQTLIGMGFKEIEVGFPAASQTDFDFVRLLIEGGHIPEDVTIQVLVQSRDELIRRTFEALAGARRVIVHMYNSTSEAQRRIVFGIDRQGCIDLALSGVRLVRELSAARPEGEVVFQYSPESFTGTEPDFAMDIVEKVAEAWGATPERKMICNLPATVEMSTPNIYADVIEWFCAHVKNRDSLIVSVHPHNDRGTGVAAAELAVMAGADRVEGTLFGNGERTGNVDVVTLALNLYTQGVDPALDLSDIDTVRRTAEQCTGLPVHPRHPYAGELVYTAFSGSHQDAIKKGFSARKKANDPVWEVPYLPIDPADVGRSYEAVIRINSQSGKGGIAAVLERDHGLEIPRPLQIDFARVVQAMADKVGRELDSGEIMAAFSQTYLKDWPLELVDYETHSEGRGATRMLSATIRDKGVEKRIEGRGNGPLDAFIHALETGLGRKVKVRDYHEHALGSGSEAQAACYVEIAGEGGGSVHGAALDSSITMASLKAVVSALNRAA